MEKQAKSGQWPAFVTLKLDSTQTFLLMGSINLSNQLNLQELALFRQLIKDVQKAAERRIEQTLKALVEPEKENRPAFRITKKIKWKARRW